MNKQSTSHTPVMLAEVGKAINARHCDLVVDATYGRGGHSRAIWEDLKPNAKLLIIDRDLDAIRHAKEKWADVSNVEIVHASFSELKKILQKRNLVGKVDAILFDLGMSSPQLDNAQRGFSFLHDGPLDMRMDTTCGISAEVWLKEVKEKDLAWVLKNFGEERFAHRIAREIKAVLVKSEITTTAHLSQLVSKTIPFREPGKHPATRTFQAIRIAINEELLEIEKVLPDALEVLFSKGRLVVISFHSLEDRIVKRFIRDQEKGDPFPADLPVQHSELNPKLVTLVKAQKPSDSEISRNPRARSAVLRVAQKVA